MTDQIKETKAGLKNTLRLQIGARVAILQHKHLKCSAHGYVQYINGAYISVRSEDMPPVESDACERTFELYPNELRVVAVYEHPRFKPGTVVRIMHLEWNNVPAKTHGIVCGVEAERILVQPIGAHKGAIISILPEDLQVENNNGNQSAEAVATQTAILALLAASGRSLSLEKLKSLLATQRSSNHVDTQLAVLANLGQIELTEARVSLAGDFKVTVPTVSEERLKSSIEALAQAELDLAEAVRQVILNVEL